MDKTKIKSSWGEKQLIEENKAACSLSAGRQ